MAHTRRKSVKDYRSPRRFASAEAAGDSARSWTAPVLWRFGGGRGIDARRNFVRGLDTHAGKAVEDYRSPRRFANDEAAGKSARSWSAPVLWRFRVGWTRGKIHLQPGQTRGEKR